MLNRFDIRSISASTSAPVTVTPCRRHSPAINCLLTMLSSTSAP
jgi:hypothetical protein